MNPTVDFDALANLRIQVGMRSSTGLGRDALYGKEHNETTDLLGHVRARSPQCPLPAEFGERHVPDLMRMTRFEPRLKRSTGAQRAADLTKQLLAFSRKQVLQPKVLDLNAIVTNLGKMLRRLIGEDVEFMTRLNSNLGRVKADPGQIEQIIVNLAINARDAMPRGGTLTIETNNTNLDEQYAIQHPEMRPDLT